jgi:3-mercaptopyruvate sulfurtransferase SseA
MSAAKADPLRRRIGRGILEVILLLAVTVAVAAGLQATRSNPLPLTLPSSVWGLEAHAKWIDTSRAEELYSSGDGLFVDVRTPEEYISGHISGAVNLPPSLLFELYETFSSWTEGQRLAFYGSREDSFALDEVLLELEKMGHTDLLAYPEGWEGWVEAKGAAEEGEDPLLNPDGFWDEEDAWDDDDAGYEESNWDEQGDAGDSE